MARPMKLSTSKITVVWKKQGEEKAGSEIRQILLAKLVPEQVMCTNYLSNIMSCLSHIVLLQGAN